MNTFKPFISDLTFARGGNQPFRSNAIVYLSSLLTDIQIFEKQSRQDTLTDINISHG
jgi:hypothetical protein